MTRSARMQYSRTRACGAARRSSRPPCGTSPAARPRASAPSRFASTASTSCSGRQRRIRRAPRPANLLHPTRPKRATVQERKPCAIGIARPAAPPDQPQDRRAAVHDRTLARHGGLDGESPGGVRQRSEAPIRTHLLQQPTAWRRYRAGCPGGPAWTHAAKRRAARVDGMRVLP